MDVTQFTQTWNIAANQKEKSVAQSHFLDLCALLGVPTPTEADPTGETYCFERGAGKAGGGDGWADVWYRGHFAIEYKGLHKDLNAAYLQILKYKDALENPPLLVVCDMDTIRIKTNFTNTKQQTYEVTLDTLDGHNAERKVSNLVLLTKLWTDPEWFRPVMTPDKVTIEAAERFSVIAQRLQDRGANPDATAHFLVQMVFCLFAEDIRLLPENIFTKLIDYCYKYPALFQQRCTEFLQAMNTGGDIAFTRIPYVNGGLFETVDVPELTQPEIGMILDATEWDWSAIEPAIFGTLFERSLDPSKRSQLGAHYTSRADIQRVVDPVVMQPLRRRFAEVVQTHGAAPMGTEPAPKMTPTQKKKTLQDIDALLHELETATILDPACGSGNFLYVALAELLTLEYEVQLYRSRITATPLLLESKVSPEQLRGIEINEIAQQLAQTAIWIGYLQWWQTNRHNRYERTPVLSRLDSIALKDALLTFHEDGRVTETEWPPARFIIGNPPFLGDKKLRSELGDDYVGKLFALFRNRVPGGADLVTYFFEKARATIEAGTSKRAGLLATNSIRSGANRRVLDRIKSSGDIFFAWSDLPWTLNGANVRISIVGFDDQHEDQRVLDGVPVTQINSNLTSGLKLNDAIRLKENLGIGFIGATKKGPFDLEQTEAQRMIALPVNVYGRLNSDVVKPYFNGMDIVRRNQNNWVVDFGDLTANQASMYEAPFEFVKRIVFPLREQHRELRQQRFWWLHARTAPDLRGAIQGLPRVLVTPVMGTHRLFAWIEGDVHIDHQLVAFARADDYFFGVLSSTTHHLWSIALASTMGNKPRYTPTTTFETYPFPWPPGQEPVDDPVVQRIAAAAKDLDDKRNAWLNPEGATEAQLKKRTLTNLYNENPTWLRNLHATLDRAVWDAYGWPADEIPAEVDEDVILGRLLALNLKRAGKPT